MSSYRVAGLALLAVTAWTCGGKNDDTADSAVGAGAMPTATGPVAASGDLLLRNEKYHELDGDDENAERLVATLSRGSLDSIMVRLEIRTSKDRILYRHEWPAVAYVKYQDPPGAVDDSALVMSATRRELAKIFAPTAFIHGFEAPGPAGKTEPDFDAIRFDIAEHEYRTRNSLKLWEPLPRGAYDAINAIARDIPLARIRTVANDTLQMPAFKYYAGGEENYVIAWSPSERRMVRIAACC